MRFGNVERAEIVPVVLDLRSFSDGKAHISEDFSQFVHHLTDRMHGAARGFGCRQRHIETLGGQPLVEDRGFERGLFGSDAVRHSFAQTVDHWPLHLPLFGGHLPQSLEQSPKHCPACPVRQYARLQARRGCPLFRLRRGSGDWSVAMSVILVRLHKQMGANGKCRSRPFAHNSKV